MCGIAGIVGTGVNTNAEQAVKRMVGALVHRGPDDEGIYRWPTGEAEPHVVLGNRRLAIIDRTPAGRQPMRSPDSRYVITLNGEIYNYLELRHELRRSGWLFRSATDTEVLLAAYARWGKRCLDRVSGMFAFAVLDTERQEIFLARDPFGIKPIYYTIDRGGVAFASEIAALFAGIDRSPTANSQAVYDYLDRGVIDIGDQTAFEGILALPPGHHLTLPLGEPVPPPVPYWQPGPRDPIDLSFDEAVTAYRHAFIESVERHLRADAPVGALLSGGVDSSAIVMAMREVGGAGLDIHTFSFISGRGGVNEEQWIDDVNGAADAVPHKLTLEPGAWWADRDDFARMRDQPIPNPVVYIQQRLFRMARAAGVLAVLTGQGSDELNAGYGSYRSARIAADVRRGRLTSAATLGARLMKRGGFASLGTVALGAFLALPASAQAVGWNRRAPPAWIDHDWVARAGVRRKAWPVMGRNVMDDRIAFRLRVGLPDLLRFEDRSAMAVSVEPRVPFLTRELADLALSLPADYLIGPRGETKYLLREAFRGLVPDSVLARPTRVGFSFPVRRWLESERARGAWSDLEDLRSVSASYLRSLRRARNGSEPLNSNQVFITWRLLGLGSWARRFGVTA